jgi:predicted MPP superfamily phosphohydrolase
VVTALHAQSPHEIQFVFTSDSHYGITRPQFRGARNVNATRVNAVLVARMNMLPASTFPKDGGLKSAAPIGAFDFVVDTGDIANREESTPIQIQSAAVSWRQFSADYLQTLHLKTPDGGIAPVFVVPGNHDASNAVGFERPMSPAVDKTSIVEIYNRMVKPATPKTTTTFDYKRDKVYFSRNIGGIHLVFVQVWPDSQARAWIDNDLKTVSESTPVFLFTHDQPDVEAKHFVNPNGRHDVNTTDLFENLLSDTFADGRTTTTPSLIEQRQLEAFLARHRNITAYFHGNSNWNQFYDWVGPDHSVVVHTFRADSPMKGDQSAMDERKLSFQVVTIDMASRLMTVRECLWDADPTHPNAPLAWGASTTVALQPRPTALPARVRPSTDTR